MQKSWLGMGDFLLLIMQALWRPLLVLPPPQWLFLMALFSPCWIVCGHISSWCLARREQKPSCFSDLSYHEGFVWFESWHPKGYNPGNCSRKLASLPPVETGNTRPPGNSWGIIGPVFENEGCGKASSISGQEKLSHHLLGLRSDLDCALGYVKVAYHERATVLMHMCTCHASHFPKLKTSQCCLSIVCKSLLVISCQTLDES